MTKAAFAGKFEIPVSMRMLGKEVIRHLEVEYSYTPKWPYYSARYRQVRQGEYQIGIGLCVLPMPRAGRKRSHRAGAAEDQWALSQLLAIGVLEPNLHELVKAQIDQIARRQDLQNRQTAGIQPVAPDEEEI